MALRRNRAGSEAPAIAHTSLPVVCIVTADDDFIREAILELIPWFQVVIRNDYEDLARWTKEAHVVAVILDIDTDGEDPRGGLSVLNELRKLNGNFVLLSLSRARTRAVEKSALEVGADAHFRSPVDLSELRLTLAETLRRRSEEAAREQMRRQVFETSRFQDFVGASEPMRLMYDAIEQVADSSINVLIRGESGTGKELAARAIVALSRRAKKPYIRLNCAALPENLIESELFGSERGAFTGATESRPGQIELADGGTLFLDEIATLTLPLQTKLLRVLEDRHVQRLGGRAQRKIDFRLICATNEPLEEMARTGRFREDLYYRIHVVPIHLPSLRERAGDIPLLCEHFLQIHCIANGLPVKQFAADALAVFDEHSWPGNVRELENLIQRLVITVRGEEIRASNLPPRLLAHSAAVQEAVLLPEAGTDFDAEVQRLEIALLTAALRRSQGGKAAAARLLRLDGQRIKYLCRKYAL
ncbi:DNA-binding NtrC family response regulator [Silvibacterium bohemicum]|uniref:DNA-binding NtrC family response regulator n=1 Tax=Silvibacterium bohemicum TaxID=1577686 RepID=A0A841JTN2_9BACT|nr:sigma-54 dependent transcriptional regulator [Silvibacterium bohemicum]MBB6144762.1 DNA-binding NtrC family response regulator [Silvibacterium bohemicum]